MVMWTTLDPYGDLSNSDSEMYTNFTLCEDKIHTCLKYGFCYKVKEFMLMRAIKEKGLQILEDSASGVTCASR